MRYFDDLKLPPFYIFVLVFNSIDVSNIVLVDMDVHRPLDHVIFLSIVLC